MKCIKACFSLSLLIFLLVSCKKEELVDDKSSLKVLNNTFNNSMVTSDNNFLLFKYDYPNLHVSKMDANGTLIWSKTLPSNVESCLPLKNNGFITVENKYDTISYKYMVLMNKYDGNANLLSSSEFFTQDSLSISNFKLTELQTGEIMLFGYNYKNNGYYPLVLKTDVNLNLMWEKSLPTSNNYYTNINKTATMNGTGDVLIVGWDFYSKIDSSGVIVWEKDKVFWDYGSIPNDIHLMKNGDLVVTGYYDGGTSTTWNNQFFAYKINQNGDIISEFIKGDSKQDFCLSSYLDSDGNITMIGMIGRDEYPNDLFRSSIRLMKLDPSLSLLFDKTYAQEQECAGTSCIVNSDKSISIIGKKSAFGNKNIAHLFFLKTNPDGSL